ncbi:uncharacterized protein TEOVI_000634900 [Trypanosoma equiperdum]|uniref:Uncharacterized protein n=5 Tax=Trypanozoon TaxID=39700 RepID=Q584T4_TRYB2|nr:hypothetical protein, conserved [Trypanosoma brucei gambiense DAL972]XP_845343.1 hypothetical protein, conserved [Trypanosoma brucei brucei TREU927]AAX80855.1 hypothetical protein, conserved [Trypanosoma brucei]RHW72018.1 hypothetical protein DPX39_060025300 [Trypanosoma brucei equiperdum]CAB09568.2 hypothetical protein [Trypanosoma brucei brucei]SCU66656.1 hypothetical protein, conserved [Trypanosoma equiperdum]AAZ11784.1 hypothetical protein, conserved [Trypanosoma brucei brucei TREU927]|eukprot:XP_011774007.1 hypothetical protein, conserved [Trypanosoma brucei gambiense DAL972]
MSVPEWARSEHSIEEAKEYLRTGNSVDFFELVSSHILREHPLDVAAFALDLVERISKLGNTLSARDYHPKRVEDNKYLQEKNVCEFLNEWILALLKERPDTDEARMSFHKRYLKSLVDGGGCSQCTSVN